MTELVAKVFGQPLGSPTASGLAFKEAITSSSGALHTLKPELQMAMVEITDTYGETELYVKPKRLMKFGKTSNADADTPTVVMDFQDTSQYEEVMLTTNAIDSISSSAADVGNARIETHSISGDVLTFHSWEQAITGQTRAALTYPGARISRIKNVSGTKWTGTIYGFENNSLSSGVPDDDSKTHILIPAGFQQSQKGQTSFSGVDYGVIATLFASVNRGNTAIVDIYIEVRAPGGIWLPITPFYTLRSTGNNNININFDPYLIIPKNNDVRVSAISDTANTIVSAGFGSYLLTTVNPYA